MRIAEPSGANATEQPPLTGDRQVRDPTRLVGGELVRDDLGIGGEQNPGSRTRWIRRCRRSRRRGGDLGFRRLIYQGARRRQGRRGRVRDDGLPGEPFGGDVHSATRSGGRVVLPDRVLLRLDRAPHGVEDRRPVGSPRPSRHPIGDHPRVRAVGTDDRQRVDGRAVRLVGSRELLLGPLP